MARYTIDTFTSASIPAGGTGTVNRTISFNNMNIYKLKVVPSAAGLSSQIEIYKKDTFLAADLLYRSGEFTGTLVDTGEDSGSAITERKEGYVCPYEDEDLSLELHIKITNNDTSARTYDFTVIYEEAVSLFTARTLGNPAVYDDLTDRDYWIPGYCTSDLMTTTENGDGTITMSPGGAAYQAIYLTSIASYVVSRFQVFPDSNGEIQIRLQVKDAQLFGTDYATKKASIVCGLHWPSGAQNDFQSMSFRNSGSVQNTLLARLYNDDHRTTAAFAEDYFSIAGVGPGTFYGELIASWGESQTPSQQFYRYGMDQPNCGYSLNGGARTYFTAASSNEPPYVAAGVMNTTGATVFLGLCCEDYSNSADQVTLVEFEVMKGYTTNIV